MCALVSVTPGWEVAGSKPAHSLPTQHTLLSVPAGLLCVSLPWQDLTLLAAGSLEFPDFFANVARRTSLFH